MYLGKLVEVGQALDVYERAAHPYTAALIATIPLPDPVRERAKSHASIRGELPSAIDPPTGCRFHTRCPLAQELCRDGRAAAAAVRAEPRRRLPLPAAGAPRAEGGRVSWSELVRRARGAAAHPGASHPLRGRQRGHCRARSSTAAGTGTPPCTASTRSTRSTTDGRRLVPRGRTAARAAGAGRGRARVHGG